MSGISTLNRELVRSRLGADVSKTAKTKFERHARKYEMSNQAAMSKLVTYANKNWKKVFGDK
jgi:hypothetical protein